jgi:hypothetical protein
MGVSRSPKPLQPNSSSCMHIPLEKRVLLLCHFDCPNVRVACSSTRIPRNAAIPSFSPAQALGSDIARCFPTVLFLTYIGARLKLTFEITVLLADWTFGGILVSTEFANRLWNFHSRRVIVTTFIQLFFHEYCTLAFSGHRFQGFIPLSFQCVFQGFLFGSIF